ncbi:FAD-binding and (Fe-S)-binding domain-containing protein [Rathayibacter sp. KR2-224]|uniref:FAD-binding and (Fe-S)-binding domain-containing protein n=1 Tax=Rathayibacter sp. KR2-224 TaxID=3400913 RepID=UPI003C0578F7
MRRRGTASHGDVDESFDRLVDRLTDVATRVGTRATDRYTAAHDASHYSLLPRAVAIASDEQQVAGILAACRTDGVPVTFRSGGTSLSGQAGSDSVVIDTRRGFRRIDVLDGGARVRTQPGATVRAVNTRLARHGTKLGPDPASEIACTVGGVVANNSSGMSCGIHANTYRTLESAVLVLPSGTIIDTSSSDAADTLRTREPGIDAGLTALRDRIRSNSESVATLRRLHSIKNTMGYGLNSFLDHDEPIDILEHVVIGSEGTLAFVAEATFRTVPVLPYAATGLLVFASLTDATASLEQLIAAGFATIELLDAAALRVAQLDPQAPPALRRLVVGGHAALLVEYQEPTADALDERLAQAPGVFAALQLDASYDPETLLSTDAGERADLWHIRKGLYTAVAGARPSGTTALLEDIAVPVDRLNETCTRLTALFKEHGYEGSVIFGHAKDGNIHFLVNERFDGPDSVSRYRAFTEHLVDLVLAQGGTLKAEHGTGRVMAPFVRRQYGDELYDVMWRLKRLIDPEMLLNPGVLLTEDPDGYLKNLKVAPTVEPEVDRCVECGYCEPVCPSKDITITPRERIVMRRELEKARAAGDVDLVRDIEREYRYDGVETCAVDGMCQTACPVLINTGDLVRRLRAEGSNAIEQRAWSSAAKHWGAASEAGGAALSVAKSVPAVLPELATRAARTLLGAETVPQYSPDLPAGGRPRAKAAAEHPVAIYFPSCTNTMFRAVGDGVAESFLRLCERAGIEVATPDGIPSLCCGTPWKSKGLTDGYAAMTDRVVATLLEATDAGRLPVVCDASSCSEGLEVMLEAAAARGIRVMDAVQFVDEHVLPVLPQADADGKVESLTLHPTCSSTRIGANPSLVRVAEAAANLVTIPDDWGCCAFAGDRGMLHPEFTASATAPEAAEVAVLDSVEHASLNRTCELGMTRATGREYRHVLQVLDDVLGPPPPPPRVE